LRIAVAERRQLARTVSSVMNLHRSGQAELLVDRPEPALADLEAALRAETGEEEAARGIARSSNASLLIDLSAVYYTASGRGHAYALPAAIESAERALEIDADSLAALWNRALALQAMGARDDASAAWDSYLRNDASSDWAKEARERRAEVENERDEVRWPRMRDELLAAARNGNAVAMRAIVTRFPMRTVALLERQLLPEWGRAVAAGDATAASTRLEQARRLADVIADTLRDPMLREVTAEARPEVAEAYRVYGEPRGEVAGLTRIRDAAARVHSPASIRFTLDLALRRYETRDHRAALAELDSLSFPLLERYPVSLAQWHWYRGLAEASLGYAADAIASYGNAAAIFESLGDRGSAGAMELMRGDAAEYAGDIEQAWSSYAAAMRELDLHGNGVMLDNVTFVAARSSLRRGYPRAALVLQSRYVGRVRSAGRPDFLCQALTARCETNAILGRSGAARADCREAATLFAALNDPASRGRLEADLRVATAAAESSGGQSVEPFTEALRVAVEGGDHFRIARLYLARARAFAAQRRDAAAENDLRSADAEIEDQRRKLSSDDFRVKWLDAARATHEELVSLLLRSGRIDDAFEIADRARGRVALDRLGQTGAGPVLPQLRARLPRDAAFVEYWLSSDDDLAVWIVTRERTTCHQFRARGIVRRIGNALDAYEATDGRPLPAASTTNALFDDLVRPWIADVQGRRLLLIATDSRLAALPFAALHDRSRNAALIADYTIALEPSAATFLARDAATAHESAIAVIGADLPDDAPLSTEREASSIGLSQLAHSSVLRQKEATPARFLSVTSGYDVVHFGGHGIESERQQGALLLQPDEHHPDGLLSSAEIERSNVRHGALVVLAACRTSRGRISSDGALSLARAFLVTGSTAVIGSLWNVEDAATSRLFTSFYRHLAAGRTPADALRLAQLDLSRIYPDPRYWAAFQIYGGAS
jgi:CHAT domain-containing protein